jgi:hypothetical protein
MQVIAMMEALDLVGVDEDPKSVAEGVKAVLGLSLLLKVVSLLL